MEAPARVSPPGPEAASTWNFGLTLLLDPAGGARSSWLQAVCHGYEVVSVRLSESLRHDSEIPRHQNHQIMV